MLPITRRAARLALILLCTGCDPDVEAEEAPEVAGANEFRSEYVVGVLAEASEHLATRGFRPHGEPRRGFLVEQGSHVHEYQMRTGQCYVFLAFGSIAMRELDLRVYDNTGNKVTEEVQPGPGAALRFCPRHNGTYYVASLATLGTGLVEVRQYVGPAGLDVRLDDLLKVALAPEDEPSREHP